MGISRQTEREIDLLEEELCNTSDPVEQKRIRRELADIERECNEEEAWREEGEERGWW